jgi:hypothetical protein
MRTTFCDILLPRRSSSLRFKSQGKSMNFINLPQRERKRNYDVNGYFRDALSTEGGKPSKQAGGPRQPKGLVMHDFQFFEKVRGSASCHRPW